MSTSVRQWDIGTWIEIDMDEDISAATDRKIHYRKPNAATGTWDASARTSDVIGYQTVDGDLDVPGTWHLQGWCEFSSGAWTTVEVQLPVARAIARVT